MTYLERWLDPNALSQIVGSLIGASIAIGLWRAERRRLRVERLREEQGRTRKFRLLLRSALVRVQREIDLLCLQCATTENEIRSKIENDQDINRNLGTFITHLLDRFPINIPNSFEFSEAHIDALTTPDADLLSDSKGLLQDVFFQMRTLKSQASSDADPADLMISLAELQRCATDARTKINTLICAL